ncbi:hypothetical protein EJ110_NYTH53699 [Nymphaea thermarum]|nr:hypothetical protein EJ110_NYTH53699 [Nymphaea thermarum]
MSLTLGSSTNLCKPENIDKSGVVVKLLQAVRYYKRAYMDLLGKWTWKETVETFSRAMFLIIFDLDVMDRAVGELDHGRNRVTDLKRKRTIKCAAFLMSERCGKIKRAGSRRGLRFPPT